MLGGSVTPDPSEMTLMRLKDYSPRAQEKFADSLLSMSNFLFCGVLATLLIAPMGALLKMMLSPDEIQISVFAAALNLPASTAFAFVLLYLLVIGLGFFARKDAMQIYSRLYPRVD